MTRLTASTGSERRMAIRVKRMAIIPHPATKTLHALEALDVDDAQDLTLSDLSGIIAAGFYDLVIKDFAWNVGRIGCHGKGPPMHAED